MNNRLYQSLYQSIPVYASLHQSVPGSPRSAHHLCFHTHKTSARRCEIRNSILHTRTNSHTAPEQNSPGHPTAQPRKRVPTCVSRPLGGGGAPPPPRKRLEGRLTERNTRCIRTRLTQNSNVPSRSDQTTDRGVGVAATRQRSRFPTIAHSKAHRPPTDTATRGGALSHVARGAPNPPQCATTDGPRHASSDMWYGGTQRREQRAPSLAIAAQRQADR